MNSSGLAGSRSEQSASLPGRPPPVSALLRTVSRALRAASRARAAINDLSTTRLATEGFESKKVINPSYTIDEKLTSYSVFSNLSLYCIITHIVDLVGVL